MRKRFKNRRAARAAPLEKRRAARTAPLLFPTERRTVSGIGRKLPESSIGSINRRPTLHLCLLLAGGISVCELGCSNGFSPTHAEGVGDEFEIASSSMAPTLLGPTRVGVCTTCGGIQRAAAESFRADLPFRCYQCGGWCSTDQDVRPGDRVRITAIPDTSAIQRFDILAVRVAENAPLQVKRVWGLPGEQIDLIAGELWIDGKIYPKNFDELARVAIPIAAWPLPSASWQLAPALPSESQLLHEFAGSPVHLGQGAARPDVDWGERARVESSLQLLPTEKLLWRYLHPAPVHPQTESPEGWLVSRPVVDDDPSIQGVSFATYPVDDLWIQLKLAKPLAHDLQLEWTYREARIVVAGQAIRRERGQGQPKKHPASAAEGHPHVRSFRVSFARQLDAAVCDGRVLLRADGGRTEMYPLPELSATRHADAATAQAGTRLAMQVSGETHLESLQIYRDILLRSRHPDAMQKQSFSRLGPAEYLLLGDNQPVSRDSRQELGAISRDMIAGRVIPKR